MRSDVRQQQEQLDSFGRKYGWRRGPFKSWKIGGWTISVGATGQPRKFIAAGRHEVREFKDVTELAEFVRENARD